MKKVEADGHLSVDDSQKETGVSTTEEGELFIKTVTHANVVFGSVRAKPKLDYSKQCAL